MAKSEITKARKALADAQSDLVIAQHHVKGFEALVRRRQLELFAVDPSSHPDWNTPNWCPRCSPKNQGYCSCEIACNE